VSKEHDRRKVIIEVSKASVDALLLQVYSQELTRTILLVLDLMSWHCGSDKIKGIYKVEASFESNRIK
jgi:hypothetical protein